MPVISTRRYSNNYVTPSSTTSVGSYRSNCSSISSTLNSSLNKDASSISSRYNFGDRSYRSSILSSGISATTGTSGSYRSRFDTDSSSLSTRIGVSRTSSSRFNSDKLPPLPPTASSLSSVTNSNHAHSYILPQRTMSRSQDFQDSDRQSNGVESVRSDRSYGSRFSLMNDLDFYEKYSPSRYSTKYELLRSRSLSETASMPRDKSPSSSIFISNNTQEGTPKSEVCQCSLFFNFFHLLSLLVTYDVKFILGSRPKIKYFKDN